MDYSLKFKTIKIPVARPARKEIVIWDNPPISNLKKLASLIPLEIKLIEISAGVSKIETQNQKIKIKWLIIVNLSHLSGEQRIEVEKIFLEERGVFCRTESDIRIIESLQMEIKRKKFYNGL